jgi:hypothetical protein
MVKYLVHAWTEVDQTQVYNGPDIVKAMLEFAFATYEYSSASIDYWFENA